jgi:hypothetical protein
MKKEVQLIRKSKSGRFAGLQAGRWGGGHYNYEKDTQHPELPKMPHSFSSLRMHQIKQTRVQVVYNVFEFGRTEHSDWIPLDNCDFEIVRKNIN